jgi:2'-5' RNA ligase
MGRPALRFGGKWMYIWIGCRLPQQFEEEIRAACLENNQAIGLDPVAFSLPQHISLKISFETEKPDEILEDLTHFLSHRRPFEVELEGIEQLGNILWMTVGENETLTLLHESLDERMKSRLGIPQHRFDTCFQFHSTLFLDPDEKKLARMWEALRDFPLQRKLKVDSMLLGTSETGKPGSYRVAREIHL